MVFHNCIEPCHFLMMVVDFRYRTFLWFILCWQFTYRCGFDFWK